MSVDAHGLHIFVGAAIGSVVVEVLEIVRAYRRPGSMPSRFFKWHYWAWRVVLALLIGGMAVEFAIAHPGYAIYFGISAPALIDAMAKNPPAAESLSGPAPTSGKGPKG